ncbi:MAG: DUF1566 domain-containing protein [Elusimicrobiota bacterium]
MMRKINKVAIFLVILIVGVVESSRGADVSLHALGRGYALPDTGQTGCWNASATPITCPAHGADGEQDGSYNPDASQPNYTDNGDLTITDNRTGLMWKKCSEGLSGDSCATGSASQLTWSQALTQCVGLTTPVYSDWRLPNIKELMSITNYQNRDPAVDTTYFPGTPNVYYWSSTSYVPSPDYAWDSYFKIGTGINSPKSNTDHVRCVKWSGKTGPIFRLT